MARKKKATTPLPKHNNPNSSNSGTVISSTPAPSLPSLEENDDYVDSSKLSERSPPSSPDEASVGPISSGGRANGDKEAQPEAMATPTSPTTAPATVQPPNPIPGNNSIPDPPAWAGLFKGPLNVKGTELGYVAPQVDNGLNTVKLLQAERIKEVEKWNNAITFFVIGAKPNFSAVNRYFQLNWNSIAKPDVYLHDQGYYVIRFKNKEDFCEVAHSGPHMYFGKPTVVKPWSPTFNIKDELIRTVPVWIRLPNLPLDCWSNDSLSRLGSAIGVPRCADECTSKQLRISFARLLVDVDVTKELTKVIHIEDDQGKVVQQQVLYEWVPPYCKTCLIIGHDCAARAAKLAKAAPPRHRRYQRHHPQAKWVPKPTVPTPPAQPEQEPPVQQQAKENEPPVAQTPPLQVSEAPASMVQTRDNEWKVVSYRSSRRKNPTPLQIHFPEETEAEIPSTHSLGKQLEGVEGVFQPP